MAIRKNSKFANHDVFKTLSAEFNLDMVLIEQIMGSQSLLTKEKIKSDDLVMVRWPEFGKFQVDRYRIAKVNNRSGLPKISTNKNVKDTGEDLLDFLDEK
jgi:hypothetical protein